MLSQMIVNLQWILHKSLLRTTGFRVDILSEHGMGEGQKEACQVMLHRVLWQLFDNGLVIAPDARRTGSSRYIFILKPL